MTENTPVTLVAVCYNHRPYLYDCLRSIAQQSLRNFDLVIVDDASSDGSPALLQDAIREFDLDARTIFHSTNQGICASFNAALSIVQTRYVAFLSTDDVMASNRLEHQVSLLDSLGDDVGFIYSNMPIITADGQPTGEHFYDQVDNRFRPVRHEMYEELLKGNFIAAPSVMMRTKAIKSAGGYDEDLVYEDYDAWCRLAQSNRVVYDDEATVLYRRADAATDTSLSDDLQGARHLQYLLANIRTLAKHQGQCARLDSIVVGRAYSYAVEAYKLGSRDRAVYRALFSHVRRDPGPRNVLITLMALLRVPIQRLKPPLHRVPTTAS